MFLFFCPFVPVLALFSLFLFLFLFLFDFLPRRRFSFFFLEGEGGMAEFVSFCAGSEKRQNKKEKPFLHASLFGRDPKGQAVLRAGGTEREPHTKSSERERIYAISLDHKKRTEKRLPWRVPHNLFFFSLPSPCLRPVDGRACTRTPTHTRDTSQQGNHKTKKGAKKGGRKSATRRRHVHVHGRQKSTQSGPISEARAPERGFFDTSDRCTMSMFSLVAPAGHDSSAPGRRTDGPTKSAMTLAKRRPLSTDPS